MPFHTIPASYITAYLVECVFLGMNCVLYAFCAYTLWGQKSLSCRVLFVINTLQFLLCTAQIIVHGIFLFIVFTVLTGNVVRYLSHINPYIITANIIFNVNYAIGSLLSIWRLYVLYDNNIRICVPALLFWIGQVCSSIYTIYTSITHPLVVTRYNIPSTLLWGFIMAVNLYVATTICYRLCIAQKRTHAVLSRSPFRSIAIILVECSALITLTNLVGIVFHTRKITYAILSLGTNTEVAVASSLLITARHAMLTQRRHAQAARPRTALEFNEMSTEMESTDVDVPITPTKTENQCSLQPPGDP